MHLIEKLLYHFKQNPSATAIVYKDQVVDYTTLELNALKWSGLLQERGIKNSFIGLRVNNPISHIYAMLGVVLSGNYYISITQENEYLLDIEAIHLPEIWLVDHPISLQGGMVIECEEWENSSSVFTPIHYPLNQYLCGFFTSGSTAKPKLVLHTLETISADTLRQVDSGDLNPRDCFDFLFSFSFSASLACIFTAFSCGGKLAIFPLRKLGLSNLPGFWKKEGVTHSSISVSTFRALCKLNYPFKTLTNLKELCVSGEAHLEKDVHLFLELFAETCKLEVAYATTETRTIARQLISKQLFNPKVIASLGKPVGDKLVTIRDEFGNILDPLVSGEIYVQSKLIANHYTSNEEASLKSFSNEEGFTLYRTGDFGFLDEQGYLHFQGRVNQEDKINGAKINFFILEKLIESLPEVDRAFTCIEYFEQQPKLLLAYAGSIPLSSSYLYQCISRKLPSHYLPAFTCFLPHLPLTHSGKPDKGAVLNQLRKQFLESQTQQVAKRPTVDNKQSLVLECIAKALQKPQETIGLNQHFVLDLGGDSMTAFICIGLLEEELKVQLSLSEFLEAGTAEQIAQLVSTKVAQEEHYFYRIRKVSGEPYQTESILFISIFNDHLFDDFYQSELSKKYQIYELNFNLFYEQLNYEQAIRLISEKIERMHISYLFGYSFSGFIAYSIACQAKHIKKVCLLDTIFYFEDSDDKVNSRQRISHILKTALQNRDFMFPMIYARNWFKNQMNQKLKLSFISSTLPSEFTKLYYQKIQVIVRNIPPVVCAADCQYFYATRQVEPNRNEGHLWQQLFVGNYQVVALKAFHGELGSNRVKKVILQKLVGAF